MQDGIIKGTGDSRYLRGGGWPPTYAEFKALAEAGQLPIDLAGINPAGWAALASALNKANLLPDDVCDALGLDRTLAQPKDALALISSKLEFTKLGERNLASYLSSTPARGTTIVPGFVDISNYHIFIVSTEMVGTITTKSSESVTSVNIDFPNFHIHHTNMAPQTTPRASTLKSVAINPYGLKWIYSIANTTGTTKYYKLSYPDFYYNNGDARLGTNYIYVSGDSDSGMAGGGSISFGAVKPAFTGTFVQKIHGAKVW